MDLVAKQAAVDRDPVQQSVEAVADPDFIVVDHRRLVGLATVAPGSPSGLAVDPATDRFRFAEAIRNRDVMPAGADGKAQLGIPAMPMLVAFGRLGGEQETEFGFARGTNQSHGPVLVVAGELRRSGTAFFDHVADLASAKDRRVHPGFQGHGIAVFEIEVTFRAGIVDRQIAAGIEANGGVVFRHLRKFGRPRAGLIRLHVAFDRPRYGWLAVEIPSRRGRGTVDHGKRHRCDE